MDFVKIGDRAWDVLVTEISENFNILYSDNTGRTLGAGARMVLDPLGCFIGHTVTFSRKKGFENEYDALFDFVSIPRFVGIPVEIVHGQETINYEAYISSGERKLKRIDTTTNKVYWDSMTLNIVPIEAQVLPE